MRQQRYPAVQPQPHKTLRELVQREEAGHRRQQHLAAMLDLRQCCHADRSQYGTSCKIGSC